MGWKTCTWKLCLGCTLKSQEMALDRFFLGFREVLKMRRCLGVKESSNHQTTEYSELKGTREDHSVQILALHRCPKWCGGWFLSKILHPIKSLLPVWLKSWSVAKTRRVLSELAALFCVFPTESKIILFSDDKVQIHSLRRKSRQLCMVWKRVI